MCVPRWLSVLFRLRKDFNLPMMDDQLVGVFGVDADPEIGRAWLFGPLIEHADWQSLADELYAASMKVIPDGIR